MSDDAEKAKKATANAKSKMSDDVEKAKKATANAI